MGCEVFMMRGKDRWEGLVLIGEFDGGISLVGWVLSHIGLCGQSQYEQICIYIYWYCTDIPCLISNRFSHPSCGLSHCSGLQKCEAQAVGHRKLCRGFVELGLTRLGLGWPVAFRPGRHITNNIAGGKELMQHPEPSPREGDWKMRSMVKGSNNSRKSILELSGAALLHCPSPAHFLRSQPSHLQSPDMQRPYT